MGGILPPALVCAAFGLALTFQSGRTIFAALVLLAATSYLTLVLGFPPHWQQFALWGCWASVIVSALSLQLPWQPSALVVAGLAVNAGLWAGAITALNGKPSDLAIALLCALLAFPAAWLSTTPARLGVKIVAGWLVAIAILASAIPLVKTPGYKADHVE
jgi:hypothetical protein